MMIQLNYRDSRPFYQQIKDNIRHLVISRAVNTNEKLPSVRELASSLAINPNTIQRAYRELETEGYIYTVPGKGSFVSEVKDAAKERRMDLFHIFDATVKELLYLATPASDLQTRIRSISEKGGGTFWLKLRM